LPARSSLKIVIDAEFAQYRQTMSEETCEAAQVFDEIRY
jgi:hypothetical protein